MKADFLAKTNSWHWLAAAVAVSALVSSFLWHRQLAAVRAERDPALARMSRHLETLRALLPEGPEALERQSAALKTRLAALRQEVDAAGFAPIPEGAESVLATKNAVERALSARNLRVLSSSFAAVDEPAARAPGAAKPARPAEQPLSADAYAREVQRAAAKLPDNMRADFLRDAQRKIAQLKAAEARAAKRAAVRPAAAPAPKAAPARLPFRTEEMAYVAEGDFRDIFLFFVGETFKKVSHHYKDIAVTRPAEGPLRLTFTLQANYR